MFLQVALGLFLFVSVSDGQKEVEKKRLANSQQIITGEALPGLEELDRIMQETLHQSDIPGAALAIAKDGRLVLARGYGLADIEAAIPVKPNLTLFNLASVTKAVTAVAILKLVDQGKLRLEDKAFAILKRLQPPKGIQEDPRISHITIRHLLLHAGGWDKTKSGEAHLHPKRVADFLHVKLPITDDQVIIYMLGQPLDFDPGSEAVYSNFGYQVLKHIIEEVTGDGYESWVQKNVLMPMAISDMGVDRHAGYIKNEAKRYPSGRTKEAAAKKDDQEGPGCWKATAVDMVRFLTALDGSRGKPILSHEAIKAMLAPPPKPLKLRPNGGFFGLGWDLVKSSKEGISYQKDGGIPGISTFIEHLPNGVDFAVLLNGSPSHHPKNETRSKEETGHPWKTVKGEIEKITKWPHGNLWEKFN